MRYVAQALGNLQDALLHIVGDIIKAIDGAGGRGDGHIGFARDVFQRGSGHKVSFTSRVCGL